MADVAGGDRARRGRARLAAAADRAARRRSRASSTTPRRSRRCTRSPRRAKRRCRTCARAGLAGATTSRACASTAPSTRTRRSTRRSSCSASGTTRSRGFPPTTSSGCSPALLAARDRAPIARPASCRSPSSRRSAPRRPRASIRSPRSRRSAQRERVWLHVDAAYAGVAAMVPGYEWILDGAERADSLVVNPHKWLFTPFDLSVLYCRRMDVLRAGVLADARVPEDERRRGRRAQPDGHRHPARPPLPRVEAVDGPAALRRRRAARAPRRAHAAGAAVRAWVDASDRVRARRAGAVQRRLLPPARRRERRRSRSACSTRSTRPARSSSRIRGSTGATCCASRSATCTRPSATCARLGTAELGRRRRSDVAEPSGHIACSLLARNAFCEEKCDVST